MVVAAVTAAAAVTAVAAFTAMVAVTAVAAAAIKQPADRSDGANERMSKRRRRPSASARARGRFVWTAR